MMVGKYILSIDQGTTSSRAVTPSPAASFRTMKMACSKNR